MMILTGQGNSAIYHLTKEWPIEPVRFHHTPQDRMNRYLSKRQKKMQTFYHKETNNALNVQDCNNTWKAFCLICAIDFISEKDLPLELAVITSTEREKKRERERVRVRQIVEKSQKRLTSKRRNYGGFIMQTYERI